MICIKLLKKHWQTSEFMKNIKILIVSHDQGAFPSQDIFLPIQAGRQLSSLKLDIQGDDTGVNISEKNKIYCELTAQYWAWKNLDCDIIGLMHYRRYFKINGSKLLYKPIENTTREGLLKYNIPEHYITNCLKKNDVILSEQVCHPYSIEIDYSCNHVREDFELVRDVILKYYPEYASKWDFFTKKNNKCSYYNMFIMKKGLFDNFCKWQFGILAKVEENITLSPHPYQQRALAFIAERLLSFYCYYHNLRVITQPIYFLHNENEKRESSIKYLLRKTLNNMCFYLADFRLANILFKSERAQIH